MSSSSTGPAGNGPRFAVVGAYVIDCIARTDRMPEWGESYQGESVHMAPGGKALNMAVALARMGAHVDAIGVVGDDLAGQTVVDALVKEGVGIEGLEVRPGGRTPICVCFSRTDGETAFLWHIDDSVAMDASTIHGVGRAPLVAADGTIVTFESPAVVPHAVDLAHSGGSLVVLQPAPPAPALPCAALPWAAVDVVVPNESEAHALLGSLGAKPAQREHLATAVRSATGIPMVVVTRGASGVSASTPSGETAHEAIRSGRVVDTTGASDAFTAALAFELTMGAPLAAALRAGQWSASRAVMRPGAM